MAHYSHLPANGHRNKQPGAHFRRHYYRIKRVCTTCVPSRIRAGLFCFAEKIIRTAATLQFRCLSHPLSAGRWSLVYTTLDVRDGLNIITCCRHTHTHTRIRRGVRRQHLLLLLPLLFASVVVVVVGVVVGVRRQPNGYYLIFSRF